MLLFRSHLNKNLHYYDEIPLNYSGYFNTCWIKNDLEVNSSFLQSNDTRFVYSDAESITAGILHTFESIAGIVLNFFVFMAVVRNKGLRKEYFTPFIVSMAISDFIFSAYPVTLIAIGYFIRDMPLPGGCKNAAFTGGFWCCSGVSHVGIAVLRCFAIYFPRQTDSRIFQYACKLTPIMGWVISLSLALLTLIRNSGKYGLECKSFKCAYFETDLEGNVTKQRNGMTFWLVLISGIAIVLLNVASYLQVRKQSKNISMAIKDINLDAGMKIIKRERKVGKLVAIISATFIIVYFPITVLVAVDPSASVTKTTLYVAAVILACSIGVFDPLVCIMFQEKYRDEIRKMFNSISTFINPAKKGEINASIITPKNVAKQTTSI